MGAMGLLWQLLLALFILGALPFYAVFLLLKKGCANFYETWTTESAAYASRLKAESENTLLQPPSE